MTSESDKYMTPQPLRRRIEDRWDLSYDPCPSEPEEDGLSVRWEDRAFVNPPYSDIPSWLQKAHREILKHYCEIAVFLIPAGVNADWFHDYVLGKSRVYFLESRVEFNHPNKSVDSGINRPVMLVELTEETIRDGVDEQDLRRFCGGVDDL